MTTLIEAARKALEAMTYADACLKKQLTTKTKHEYAQDLLLEAGTALRQAIEQAEKQEPVAWWRLAEDSGHQKYPVVSIEKPHHQWTTTRPLVFGDTPPPAERTPRQPLTDEEISDLWCKVSNTDFVTADTHEFARAIEAAHGIKGEA